MVTARPVSLVDSPSCVVGDLVSRWLWQQFSGCLVGRKEVYRVRVAVRRGWALR